MASANSDQLILVDGSQDFGGGVDSNVIPTLASELAPNGLKRNQTAWLVNAHVRDGGVNPRGGILFRGVAHAGGEWYQGGIVYEPLTGFPYLVFMISGVPYRMDLQTYAVVDMSAGNPALRHPSSIDYAFFAQGEEFLVIQAGDYSTLPLFWDGTTLRRSIGITNTSAAPGTPGVNEIPAAGPMVYYMSRFWYANYRTFSAGDIAGGNSGTIPFAFRDAILNVTENPLVVGGDGFTLPTFSGNIRAIKFAAAIDAVQGQGQLFIFTRKQIYSMSPPITRADWIAADSANRPEIKVAQFVNGAVNDRSIVAVNGDLFFQSLEPSIRSLFLAVRYFQQWGNRSISANIERLLNFNDRGLMRYCSGMAFNNRLYQGALPLLTDSGVVQQAWSGLDFTSISSFSAEFSPVWEGHQQGIQPFQFFTADFGGLERAFALARSQLDGSIGLWEFSENRFDTNESGDKRIGWIIETPGYHFGLPNKQKQLQGGELWVDRVYGKITIHVYYRVDSDPCWIKWHVYEFCVARTSCENPLNPICYPEEQYGEGYNWPIVLPTPPRPADSMRIRPSNLGYQFQVKIEIEGFCRLRAVFIYGAQHPRGIYQGLNHQTTPPFRQALNV